MDKKLIVRPRRAALGKTNVVSVRLSVESQTKPAIPEMN